MDFEVIIKQFNTSKCELVCVKIPDHIQNEVIDNDKHQLFGNASSDISVFDWQSPKLPAIELKRLGYSHDLSNEDMESICADQWEYYRVLGNHDIVYNFSAWTGKWVILIAQ